MSLRDRESWVAQSMISVIIEITCCNLSSVNMNPLLIPPPNRSYKQRSASGRQYMFSPATDCVMRCCLNKSDAEYTYCTLLQTHWKPQQHFLSNSGPQSLKNENMNFLWFSRSACNCRDHSETVLCTKTADLLPVMLTAILRTWSGF